MFTDFFIMFLSVKTGGAKTEQNTKNYASLKEGENFQSYRYSMIGSKFFVQNVRQC